MLINYNVHFISNSISVKYGSKSILFTKLKTRCLQNYVGTAKRTGPASNNYNQSLQLFGYQRT